jgi:hypothetical protein
MISDINLCMLHPWCTVTYFNGRKRLHVTRDSAKAHTWQYFCYMILIVCIMASSGCRSGPVVEKEEETVIEEWLAEPEISEPTEAEELPYYFEFIPPSQDMDISLDPCSFTHYTYYQMFTYMHLMEIIPPNERTLILKQVYAFLQRGYQVNVIVRKYLGVGPLVFAFFFVHEFNGPVLHLKTNYDEGAAVLVPMEIPKEEWYRCIAARYPIIDTKLVRTDDLYSEKKEKALRDEQNPANLARFYIYDEKADNDEGVEELLNTAITMEQYSEKKFMAVLLLAYFYLLNNNTDEARIRMNQAYYMLQNTFPSGNRELAELYDIRRHELEIMHVLEQEIGVNGASWNISEK